MKLAIDSALELHWDIRKIEFKKVFNMLHTLYSPHLYYQLL